MSESTNQDQIEQDLEHTRARMDSRLTELQGRLSPGQILDDLMGYFRGSEGGDFARNLLASVKSNPMPAALTGISLAWLMAANPRPQSEAVPDAAAARTRSNTAKVRVFPTPAGSGQAGTDDLEQRFRKAEQDVAREPGDTEETYNMRLDDARGAVLGVKREPEDTAQSLSQRIQDALSAAKENVGQTANSMRSRASDAADQLATSAQSAGDQLTHRAKAAQTMGSNVLSMIADNPVLLGAIGMAVGALLGALVPQSEQEEAALGEMAGQARETARNLSQEVMDRGGQVAQQVLDAGRDSARAHGLTADKSIGDVVEELRSGDLAGAAKQVAQDVLKSGDEAFRKDGLKTDQPTSANGSPSSPQIGSRVGEGGGPSRGSS
jgi:ElaB/YqjD/DUF883 family membrane-anchored ribosome-binding protein